jgi:hypothetical protein
MPTAQKRRRKTRTKCVSLRPALAVSTLLPNQLELCPGKEHLVCPDCVTWCPITGTQSSTPKLVPHHTERAGTPGQRRCIGSNRLVQLDLTVDRWQQRLTDAIADAAPRRATQALRKPKTPPAPAASQVKPAPLSAEMIRQVFRSHRTQCAACKGEATDKAGESLPCPDGERLAVTYLRLVRQEPRRAKVREFFARERERFDRIQAAQMPKQRAAEWAKVGPAVKRADDQREQLPAGDAPTEGLNVPLDPIHFAQ